MSAWNTAMHGHGHLHVRAAWARFMQVPSQKLPSVLVAIPMLYFFLVWTPFPVRVSQQGHVAELS